MGTATVVGIAPAFPTNTSLTTTPVMVTVALLSFPAGRLRLGQVKSLAQGSGTQQSLALCTCDINQCPSPPCPTAIPFLVLVLGHRGALPRRK